jgi:hypothetical protein
MLFMSPEETARPQFSGNPEVTEIFDSDVSTHYLECGDKVLAVMLPDSGLPNGPDAATYISSNNGNQVPGATTALYNKAREILERYATETRRPVLYGFSTKNPEMRAWAIANGPTIFDWTVHADDEYGFYAEKIFKPQPV